MLRWTLHEILIHILLLSNVVVCTTTLDAPVLQNSIGQIKKICIDSPNFRKRGTIKNLQIDINNPESLLGVYDENLIRITPDRRIQQLTGMSYGVTGYADGKLRDARFKSIKSFLQFNSTLILVAANRCVRSMDLARDLVKPFHGDCSDDGDSSWRSPTGKIYADQINPYHLISDPSNNKSILVTDANYVRRINVETGDLSTVFQHDVSRIQGFPASAWQFHWISITKDKIYIATERNGLLVLNSNWKLLLKTQPLHTNDTSFIELKQIYSTSKRLLLITYAYWSRGFQATDTQTFLFDMDHPAKGSSIENSVNVREYLGGTSDFYISWVNNRLIYTTRRSSTQESCLSLLSVSIEGLPDPCLETENEMGLICGSRDEQKGHSKTEEQTTKKLTIITTTTITTTKTDRQTNSSYISHKIQTTTEAPNRKSSTPISISPEVTVSQETSSINLLTAIKLNSSKSPLQTVTSGKAVYITVSSPTQQIKTGHLVLIGVGILVVLTAVLVTVVVIRRKPSHSMKGGSQIQMTSNVPNPSGTELLSRQLPLTPFENRALSTMGAGHYSHIDDDVYSEVESTEDQNLSSQSVQRVQEQTSDNIGDIIYVENPVCVG